MAWEPDERPDNRTAVWWPTAKAFLALGLPVPDHPLYRYDLIVDDGEDSERGAVT